MSEPKNIDDLINQDFKNAINNSDYDNYDYNYQEESDLEDDILKYCVRKKLENEKNQYGKEIYQYFNKNQQDQQNIDIKSVEKDRSYWSKIMRKFGIKK